MSYVCDHCGRETGPACGTVTAGNKMFRLCHTSHPDRPDCYRRVTIYHEVIGFLLLPGVEGALVGVKDIFGHLHEDDGTVEGCLGCFYDIPTVVCVTHKRFVPCRNTAGICVFSCREDDVEEVRRYQSGELPLRVTVPRRFTFPGVLLAGLNGAC